MLHHTVTDIYPPSSSPSPSDPSSESHSSKSSSYLSSYACVCSLCTLRLRASDGGGLRVAGAQRPGWGSSGAIGKGCAQIRRDGGLILRDGGLIRAAHARPVCEGMGGGMGGGGSPPPPPLKLSFGMPELFELHL